MGTMPCWPGQENTSQDKLSQSGRSDMSPTGSSPAGRCCSNVREHWRWPWWPAWRDWRRWFWARSATLRRTLRPFCTARNALIIRPALRKTFGEKWLHGRIDGRPRQQSWWIWPCVVVSPAVPARGTTPLSTWGGEKQMWMVDR